MEDSLPIGSGLRCFAFIMFYAIDSAPHEVTGRDYALPFLNMYSRCMRLKIAIARLVGLSPGDKLALLSRASDALEAAAHHQLNASTALSPEDRLNVLRSYQACA
jgi:hypothetical protein